MRLELQGLRSLTRLRDRELATVKRLAAIVLQQRTEVEQFFLDALTQVTPRHPRRVYVRDCRRMLAALYPVCAGAP